MKKHLLAMLYALLLCVLFGSVAIANVKSKTVTFNEEVTVGDKQIKKGNYRVSFDDQTNELTISSGKEVVVKTKAHLEESKAKTGLYFEPLYTTRLDKESGRLWLTGVHVGNGNAIIGGDNASTAAQ